MYDTEGPHGNPKLVQTPGTKPNSKMKPSMHVHCAGTENTVTTAVADSCGLFRFVVKTNVRAVGSTGVGVRVRPTSFLVR